MSRPSVRIGRTAGAAALCAAVLVTAAAPANAIPTDGDPPPNQCQISGSSISAPKNRVEAGRAVTLSWSITFGFYCGAARLTINGEIVSNSGQMVVRPLADTAYKMVVQQNLTFIPIGTVNLTVYRPHSDILTQLTNDEQTRVSRVRNAMISSEMVPLRDNPGQQIIATGDFDGDTSDDILWRVPATGQTFQWTMRNGDRTGVSARGIVPAGTAVQAVADFNGNGKEDILWRDAQGFLRVWLDSSNFFQPISVVPGQPDNPYSGWQVLGAGDFNSDGYSDILWRHVDGQVAIHYLKGTLRIGEAYPGNQGPSLTWKVADVADFDGDGFDDILWRQNTGTVAIWFKASDLLLAYPPSPTLDWTLLAASDFNFDGKADILWRKFDGVLTLWAMNGAQILSGTIPGPIEAHWKFIGAVHSNSV